MPEHPTKKVKVSKAQSTTDQMGMTSSSGQKTAKMMKPKKKKMRGRAKI